MRQNLKIALQMDPLEGLDLKGDTTFILGFEAIRRGFNILSIVTEARRAPLATKDFHSRINNLGTQVSKKNY